MAFVARAATHLPDAQGPPHSEAAAHPHSQVVQGQQEAKLQQVHHISKGGRQKSAAAKAQIGAMSVCERTRSVLLLYSQALSHHTP